MNSVDRTGQREQPLLRSPVIRSGPRIGLAALITSVRLQVPPGGVGELQLKNVIEPAAAGGVAYRRHDLDPLSQVARAPVRGTDVVIRVVTIREMIDTGVLEEASDDAGDADPFRQSHHAGTERADAPDDERDLDPRLGRPV